MKLTMLGTGNALVTKCYNTCFVIENENDYLMVDAGGGNTVLNQLEKAEINWKDVKHIFVTHKHIDHLLGMIWMIRLICQNMAAGKYEGEAYIYGHQEVIEMLETISQMLLQSKQTKFIHDRLHLVVVNDGQTKEILGKKVTFFDIHSTKAKQFGFMMELDQERKLTCCGDEPYHPMNQMYVQNSDWLLHEAFCLHSQADIFHPYEKHHSTVKDACQIAQSLNIQNLILYHTEDKNIQQRRSLYLQEGQKYFQGNKLNGTVSLSDLNLEQISKLGVNGLADQALSVVQKGYISADFPFYYAQYNTKTGKYDQGVVDKAESLLTVYHLAKQGKVKQQTLDWLSNAVNTNGIFAKYKKDGTPVSRYQYETPGVYALTALIALETGEKSLFTQSVILMEKSRTFQTTSESNGAFSSKNSDKALDNCLPLLLYASMEQKGL